MFFYKLLNFFYHGRILGQAGRKIGESVGSISRGPTPGLNECGRYSKTHTVKSKENSKWEGGKNSAVKYFYQCVVAEKRYSVEGLHTQLYAQGSLWVEQTHVLLCSKVCPPGLLRNEQTTD